MLNCNCRLSDKLVEHKEDVAMTFAELSWEDLTDWAGSRVVTRGKSYRSHVEDLRVTTDGRLVAWVEGSARYATVVSFDTDRELDSLCTCPYCIACKHAVATVLCYLEALQAGKTVPLADVEDERLKLVRSETSDCDDDSEDKDGNDGEGEAPVATPQRRHGKPVPAKPETAVRRYLESFTHAGLLELVTQLATDFSEVRQCLVDRAELQAGDVTKLIASTRREIQKASAKPGLTRRWSDERHIPDYSRVRERLDILLRSGHADEVVALGQELWKQGLRQAGASDDEGETGQEIASCMAIVFKALKASSKTGPERLLWEIDTCLGDGYCILDHLSDPLSEPETFTPADWSAVADELARRLAARPVAAAKRDREDSSSRFERAAIMHRLLDALDHAGRASEKTAILERETEITHCYVELVDHLLAVKQPTTAAAWARKGYEKTIAPLTGIAWQLEERLRQLASSAKDLPLVAAFRAMEFFDRPGVERFIELREAATALGLWEDLHPRLLHWLETGVRPDVLLRPARTLRQVKQSKGMPQPPPEPKADWPLPSTGLQVPGETGRCRPFPDTDTLIDLAIKEKRHDDVLRWYTRETKRGGYGYGDRSEIVAETVQETHPDAALAIWRRLAMPHLAQTGLGAYEVAGAHLEKMKTVYQRTGRLAEWEQLLSELRALHARKPRLLEVLDRLAGKRSRILKA